MVKVLTVLTMDKAKELQKNKFVSLFNTFPNLSEKTLNVLRYISVIKNNYDEIPILGMSRIYGDSVNLVDNWDDLTDFLPSKPGNIYIEIHLDESDCLYLDKDVLFKFEMINRKQIPKDKRAFLIQQLIDKCFKEPTPNSVSNELVLLKGIDLNKCKLFCRLDDNWDRNDMRTELSADILNSLGNF